LFLFTQNQKELIGEDGLDAFGQTYSKESRVVVVLFRAGWGETRWTGVEDRAIRDLYLNGGWRRIIVFSLDGSKPSWIPDSYIWAGDRYGGLPTLAAAIERKVQEEGGQVGEEEPLALAARVTKEQAAEERREQRRFTQEAVQAAGVELQKIELRMRELTNAFSSENPNILAFSNVSGVSTLRTSEVAVGLLWEGAAMNSIRGAELQLHQTIHELGAFGWNERNARILSRSGLYLIEDERTWMWVDADGVRRSSSEVAEDAFRRLFEEHRRRKKVRLLRSSRGR